MKFLGVFVAFTLLSGLTGLSEVSWSAAALPGWYGGWAALCGVVGLVGLWLAGRALGDRPRPQRALLHGVGWGLPVMALLAGPKLLKGEFDDPVPLLLFVAVWSVAAVVYGSWTLPDGRARD